jgi:hypothetical protein
MVQMDFLSADDKMSKTMETQEPTSTEKHLDAESGSVAVAQSAECLDPATVRSLKRKADFILLPMLATMYLFKSVNFTYSPSEKEF